MHSSSDFWHQYSDPTALIMWGGYVALTIIIFSETGLLIGFFLPGDSLLVSAGLIASRGMLDVWFMCALLSAAAILGQTVGYAIGRAAGPRLFAREDSHVLQAKPSAARARLLREARWHDDRARALHADRAHVRSRSGGRGAHALSRISALQS